MLTRNFQTCQDFDVDLQIEDREDVKLVIPSGEMVTGEADQRLRAVLEQFHRQKSLKVIIDFSGVPYIDSSVLGQLVYGYSLLREKGGNLKILNPSPRIRDLFEVTRLVSVFEIFESEEEALASWS